MTQEVKWYHSMPYSKFLMTFQEITLYGHFTIRCLTSMVEYISDDETVSYHMI